MSKTESWRILIQFKKIFATVSVIKNSGFIQFLFQSFTSLKIIDFFKQIEF